MKNLKNWALLAGLIVSLQTTHANASDDGLVGVFAASALILGQINNSGAENGDDSGEHQVTFVPSIGYQQKRLQFEQKYRYTSGGTVYGTDAEFDADLPTLNVSLTTSYDRVFMTLKYEQNLTEGTSHVDETLQPSEGTYYFNAPGGTSEIDRKDISLTFGYNVYGGLNVFVGYMKGRTEISPEQDCYFDPNSGVNCYTGTTSNSAINLAWLQANKPRSGNRYEQIYEEDGPFAGLSYAWQIADAGTLSFSAAYAKMDGSYKDNFSSSIGTNLDFGIEGDSDGTSFGLTWAAPLGENSNYFFDIRQQKYDMDGSDSNGNFPGSTAKTEETMTGITGGIQFYY